MMYVFEKGCSMPLCGYKDNNYYKFETGEIIESKELIEFINNGLKLKTMKIKEIELLIYKIVDINGKLRAYQYVIDGLNNFLSIFKQPLSRHETIGVIDKLNNRQYKQEIVWGEKNG